MNICVIGKGSIGNRHASIYKKLGCKVYFFRTAKKDKLAKKFVNEIYSLKDLSKKKFDLFCICNPTSLHLQTLKKTTDLQIKKQIGEITGVKEMFDYNNFKNNK